MHFKRAIEVVFGNLPESCLSIIGRFSFFQSGRFDQLALQWNERVLGSGSGQNGFFHGSEPLSSPAAVGKIAGIWRVVAGKNARAQLGPFHLNWSEPVLYRRPERTKGKQSKNTSRYQ